jgi:hypothetical protein
MVKCVILLITILLIVIVCICKCTLKNDTNNKIIKENYGNDVAINGIYVRNTDGSWTVYRYHYSSLFDNVFVLYTGNYDTDSAVRYFENKNIPHVTFIKSNRTGKRFAQILRPELDIIIGTDNANTKIEEKTIKIPPFYSNQMKILSLDKTVIINNGNELIDFIKANNLLRYVQELKKDNTISEITWGDIKNIIARKQKADKFAQYVNMTKPRINNTQIQKFKDLSEKIQKFKPTTVLLLNNVSYDSNYTLSENQKKILGKLTGELDLSTLILGEDSNSKILEDFFVSNSILLESVNSMPPIEVENLSKEIDNIINQSSSSIVSYTSTPLVTVVDNTKLGVYIGQNDGKFKYFKYVVSGTQTIIGENSTQNKEFYDYIVDLDTRVNVLNYYFIKNPNDPNNQIVALFPNKSVIIGSSDKLSNYSSDNYIKINTESNLNIYTINKNIGNVLNGWTGGHGNDNPGVPLFKRTPEECMKIAEQQGKPAWGYRNYGHPLSEWRNTCMYYDPWFKDYYFKGNDNDKAHILACTKKDKQVVKGCV